MVDLTLRNWAGPETQLCLPEPIAWSPGGDKSLSLESPGTVFVIHPGQSRWGVHCCLCCELIMAVLCVTAGDFHYQVILALWCDSSQDGECHPAVLTYTATISAPSWYCHQHFVGAISVPAERWTFNPSWILNWLLFGEL